MLAGIELSFAIFGAWCFCALLAGFALLHKINRAKKGK